MADLSFLGGVRPAEFDDMLFTDSVRLARRLRARHEAQQKFQVELVKVVVESNGGRLRT